VLAPLSITRKFQKFLPIMWDCCAVKISKERF